MDLKNLRQPTHTASELAAARAGTKARAPRIIQAPTKSAQKIEPVARTELWRQFYAGAVRDRHPEPEKFADSAVRSREMALTQLAKRHHTVVLAEAPKPPCEMASTGKTKSAAKAPGPRCQAKTLEGRQCGFAATCGKFCKKHAPKEAPRPGFQLVKDPKRFTDCRLKGFLNAKPSVVATVLGQPNGTPDAKVAQEWKLVFTDGMPVTVFYTKDDPSLHVCGEDLGALARVRQLLNL